MALGFSGSNGGVGKHLQPFRLQVPIKGKSLDDKLEAIEFSWKDALINKTIREDRRSSLYLVDFFVNNSCNLNCVHCYDNYMVQNNNLSIDDLQSALLDFYNLGARVFGIVGKEPLLSWHNKTKPILGFLKDLKQNSKEELRYGLVTNGTLLSETIADDLSNLDVSYIDISFDGSKEVHDKIRGNGNYIRALNGFKNLRSKGLGNRVTVSYTLNSWNKNSFFNMLKDLSDEGIQNFLVSPYLTIDTTDPLSISTEDYLYFANELKSNFSKLGSQINIYLKNDFYSKQYQIALIESGLLNLNELQIDEHMAIWDIKRGTNQNNLFMNVQMWDVYPNFARRLSHDGYISSCHDMFYKDYPQRALGNVKEIPVLKILNK